MVFQWLNFTLFIISCFIMGYLYILSIQPVQRSKERGEKAWDESKRFRSIAGIFELVSVVTMILWAWYPIESLDWPITDKYWSLILVCIILALPLILIMVKGILDAGDETIAPSKDTDLYKGIYRYIRHPQVLGEFPLFIVFSLLVNSWFLVIFCTVFIFAYIPIMVHYEEKDLEMRFGDVYRDYKKRTGAFFPKIKKKS